MPVFIILSNIFPLRQLRNTNNVSLVLVIIHQFACACAHNAIVVEIIDSDAQPLYSFLHPSFYPRASLYLCVALYVCEFVDLCGGFALCGGVALCGCELLCVVL